MHQDGDRSGFEVLIVEDDPDLALAMAELVTNEGYRVVVARTAAEARQVVRDGVPDLILQDLTLPDSAGFELLGQLRDAGAARTPAVAVSGWQEQLQGAWLAQAGYAGFLRKPFTAQELCDVLSQARTLDEDPTPGFGAGRRLLLIDDQDPELDGLYACLREHHFTVEVADPSRLPSIVPLPNVAGVFVNARLCIAGPPEQFDSLRTLAAGVPFVVVSRQQTLLSHARSEARFDARFWRIGNFKKLLSTLQSVLDASSPA